MIKIISIGKIKEKYLKDGIEDYLKRITKYHKINLIELPDSNIDSEGNEIIKYLNNKDYIISLAIEGTNLSSEELSKKIDNIFITNPNITFIIGGSNGIREDIKKRSNYLLSFSKMTFPHGLFRLILLEQIYRSFKILNNETYHK
ncbi:MAG: 23S rRNA (pseudouridine(1915)-N(3))-methyltransferase RlmH [Mycoplasmatota bacterium]|mgnify:FL=1|nr:23S rRNA (pseudouridine(1915)-N(3))-methyltransferase RlmH [Mycoplasmatota bacterium]